MNKIKRFEMIISHRKDILDLRRLISSLAFPGFYMYESVIDNLSPRLIVTL